MMISIAEGVPGAFFPGTAMCVRTFTVAMVLLATTTLLGVPPDGARTANAGEKENGPAPAASSAGVDAAGVDAYGDPLPSGAIARLGTVRFRHGSWMGAIAFSPDGKTLASTGHGTGFCLWDATTGKPTYRFPFLQRSHTAVAFSPDGKTLVLNNLWDRSYQGLVFLDVAAGKEIRRWADGMRRMSLAFSPDGLTLAGGLEDNTVRICDVRNGRELHRLRGENDAEALVFSPDGTLLALGNYDKTIGLWDTRSGKELARLKGHANPVASIAFSPDGSLLASASYNDDDPEPARLWDVAARRLVRTLGKEPRSVAFSPTEKLLAGGNHDGSVSFWEPKSGRLVRHFDVHARPVISVAFAPDGKTVASAAVFQSGIVLSDAATGKHKCRYAGHRGAVDFVAFAPGGKLLTSVARDQTVRTWDWASGSQHEVRPWPVRNWRTYHFVVSQNGKMLAATHSVKSQTSIVVSDLSSGKQAGRFGPGIGPVSRRALALSPQGDTLAVSGKHIQVWDVATQKERYQLQGTAGRFGLAFSPDGATLVSAAGEPLPAGRSTLRVWQVSNGKEGPAFAHAQGSAKVVFCPDGKMLFTTSFENGVPGLLWDVAGRRELYAIPDTRPWLEATTFSADGRLLALAGGWLSGPFHN
jgi:WD40 repeat protein